MPATHIVERAYQLAEAGQYLRRSEIDRALEREGYTIADLQHLQGAGITRDLNQRCRAARSPTGSGARS